MASTAGNTGDLLQYSIFNSAINPSFWHKVSQLKLEVFKLEETPKAIWGFYFNSALTGRHTELNVDFSAFNKDFQNQVSSFPVLGTLINKNTLESFRECDKIQLLNEEGRKIWGDIMSGAAIDQPARLLRFVLLTFADLKKYHYYYWFGFPAASYPEAYVTKPAEKIQDVLSSEQLDCLEHSLSANERTCFVVEVSDHKVEILPLKELSSHPKPGCGIMLGFADPCTLPENPGWPLRNILALVSYHWPELVKNGIDVLCLRQSTQEGSWSAANSRVLSIRVSDPEKPSEVPKFIGWEKNERGKFGPRFVNLSKTMDPVKLAETSVDLNLKLMKWRLLPTLDLTLLKQTRCLVLGAGTLGCNVARTLMGWGIRHITLVDNGHVSYSNPVRQSLFKFEDCLSGGQPKAQAAAKALKDIFPGVMAEGVVVSIPMPGHTVGDSVLEETRKNVAILELLVKSHDVVFLLMDSRESRWLPTVLARFNSKLVINAALGFDSYLVMRHGVREQDVMLAEHSSSLKSIPGSQLGCYFCNDVIAPRNSMHDRTLDQQCTVTRPGVSMIAAGLAVELMVSVLQHRLRGQASAELSSGEGSGEDECSLGLVPHSIRGFLSQFQQILPATRAFNQCIACSDKVISEYRSGGFDFLRKVFDSPGYLEDLTGLTELHKDTVAAEIWELSDTELSEADET